jgi:hypothetical protein
MVDVQPAGTGHVPGSGLLGPVLEEYAEALGIPIHVHAPTNHLSPPRWGDGLHVHLFALPVRPRWFTLWPVTPVVEIPTVFSWALTAGTKKALAPGSLFSRGVVKQDQKGHAVSGMLGENIYVLYDLLGQPDTVVPVMLRRTFDLSLGGLTEWLSLATGRLPHQIQVSLHRLSHKTTLVTLDQPASRGECGTTHNAQYREAGIAESGDVVSERMAAVEVNLKELSRQMALQTRLLRNCQERFRMLKKAEQSEEALVREFDGLLGIPEVRDVEILGDRLCVFTDTVDTVVAGKRYRLGRFRVDIRFNGDVTIKNLTRPHGYYDHPHVWNAKPCLGNIGQSVMKLVTEFQWVAAAQLLLEYLKTVNPKEWYTPIHHWEELPT